MQTPGDSDIYYAPAALEDDYKHFKVGYLEFANEMDTRAIAESGFYTAVASQVFAYLEE